MNRCIDSSGLGRRLIALATVAPGMALVFVLADASILGCSTSDAVEACTSLPENHDCPLGMAPMLISDAQDGGFQFQGAGEGNGLGGGGMVGIIKGDSAANCEYACVPAKICTTPNECVGQECYVCCEPPEGATNVMSIDFACGGGTGGGDCWCEIDFFPPNSAGTDSTGGVDDTDADGSSETQGSGTGGLDSTGGG